MTQNNRPVQPQRRPAPQGQQRPVQQRPMQGQPTRRPAPGQYASGRPVQAQPARRPAAPARPAAPSRRKGGIQLPGDFLRVVILGVVLIAVGFGLQFMWPNGFPMETGAVTDTTVAVSEIHGSGPIRINELMGSNSGTLLDENGLSADWVEICNVSAHAVDLAGYSLAKTEKATNVFTFPAHVLQPGECVIVFADSTLKNAEGGEYHAPFRLSSQGGTLMLFSASGTAVDSVNFPAMAPDTSYVRESSSVWNQSSQPTPGMENTAEAYQALHAPNTAAGVEITEVVADNTQYAADENGLFHDYFELHNTTGAAVDLSGWFVSDSAEDPAAWRLPEGFVLQPGEYRIVYASGLNRANADAPHAAFGLSPEGEQVVLSDRQGRIVDQVTFDLLKADQAWQKNADGSWSVGTPTPAAVNG